MYRDHVDQGSNHTVALGNLGKRNKLIRSMSVQDVAGSAHNCGNTSALE
jgi:hypothetical protein